MSYPMLYPEEQPMAKRQSSIDQFGDYLSVMKQGGWAPIVFDQLDGINCETIKTHPVAIDFSQNGVGYVYPEGECKYFSDKFIVFDKEGVEQRQLPACFGGTGEFYDVYTHKNAFVNGDNNTSIGTHSPLRRRVGLSYVACTEALPPVE